ncbi:sensor domain-containing diguanylate cyclase [Neiella marina]|uniref:diguanylate cyclase n=1 Tax=Neiella holothuriorum TaxID=2870530 RepID=A0ABS7EDX1_9GAMM|nr:diguanylate cyclase [Neiella holothuriorum]MBW8190527.1 sensor domain-containing diguanylate cyclase [Neiella holothuriorum]
MRRLFSVLSLLLLSALTTACSKPPSDSVVDLSNFEHRMMGQHTRYFQEQGTVLSWQQAANTFADSPQPLGRSESIALGIGTDPVWLHLQLNNPDETHKAMRLAIKTPWLDVIDSYLVQHGQLIRHVNGGDHLAFHQRPMAHENFAFEHTFATGKTDIYVRVESLGPMAIPLELSRIDQAHQLDAGNAYRYGLLYGMLLALSLYNLLLYIITREKEFGLYSLYLAGFMINSLSYTGQLHEVITADLGVHFQDWLDCFLMITYSVAGLHFARSLLKTKSYAPRLDKIVIWTTIVFPVGILLGALANQLVFSLVLSFMLNSGFAALFVVMGIRAKQAQVDSALLFIVASVTAACCIGISTMAVAGIVPYNVYTFQAIEVGMVFEAIMLAVVLAKRFNLVQQNLVVAKRYADTDPLTNVNNRRGFQRPAEVMFNKAVDSNGDIAVLLIDIDNFKQVNDQYGHTVGDQVIQKAAHRLAQSARKTDLIARWGGEEFIMLLDNTSQKEGRNFAERIRLSLAELRCKTSKDSINFTVSIGVAGSNQRVCAEKNLDELTLADLIKCADAALYEAKNSGRNKVVELCGDCPFTEPS